MKRTLSKRKHGTTLQALTKHSVIVADTGDWEEIAEFAPRDVTTNPTLIYKNIQKLLAPSNHPSSKTGGIDTSSSASDSQTGLSPNTTPPHPATSTATHTSIRTATGKVASTAESAESAALMQALLKKVTLAIRTASDKEQATALATEELFVATGLMMLERIPGRISIEVPARYSFDTEKTLAQAKSFVSAYEKKGIGQERLLIKIAATWEGLLAAEILEKMDIHTNLTLVFGLEQAMRAADNGVTLISPFVGRVTDWYKAHEGRTEPYLAAEDPGVRSVREIYHYLKKYHYSTEIMAASFRSTEQIIALAGCDLLTIAPKFLRQLSQQSQPITQPLKTTSATKNLSHKNAPDDPIPLTEEAFRWRLNQNKMVTDKLREGIALFHQDSEKLRQLLLMMAS